MRAWLNSTSAFLARPFWIFRWPGFFGPDSWIFAPSWCVRWAKAWWRFGLPGLRVHFERQRRIKGCCACGRLTLPLERYFQCTSCECEYEACGMCVDADAANSMLAGQPALLHRRHPGSLVEETLPLNVDLAPIQEARSTGEALTAAFRIFAQRKCIGWRERNERTGTLAGYSWWSYAEVEIRTLGLSAGLDLLLGNSGKQCESFVGLLGAMSVPWLLTDYACLLGGHPSVLMYRSTTSEQLSYIARDTNIKVLVCSIHLAQLVRGSEEALAGVHVVWIDDNIEAYLQMSGPQPTAVGARASFASERSWDELATKKKSSIIEYNSAVPDSTIVKLLPTSGTTGRPRPKIVVVTEGMLRPSRLATAGRGVATADPTIIYAYEVMRQSHDVPLGGGRIGCFSGSYDKILEDVQALRPTVFAATPIFWKNVHSDFELETSRRNEPGIEGEVLVAWRDRCLLGNRIQVLISTGAPLPHKIARWLFRVIGRTIVNGYGTTETGGLSSNGRVNPGAGVEMRLVDAPALGYLTSDKPFPRGEILARSPRMHAEGYYSRDRSSGAEGVVEDEEDFVVLGGTRYFRTGDIGELVGAGQMRIIDRAKSHFKLSQGVFVAPEPLEVFFGESPFVDRCFVWGNGNMANVCCAVVPSHALRDAIGEDGCSLEHCALAETKVGKTAASLVLRSLQAIGAQHKLRPYEIPTMVVLDGKRWSSGLVTSMGKPCRPALIKHYRERFVNMDEAASSLGGDFKWEASAIAASGVCSGVLQALVECGCKLPPCDSDLADICFLSLGLDSLGVARLSSKLSERFGVQLSPRSLCLLETLRDVEAACFGGDAALRRISMRGKAVNWASLAEDEASFLDEEIKRIRHHLSSKLSLASGLNWESSSRDVRGTVVMTGASGFLGAFILNELLAPSSRVLFKEIVCIVRATSDKAAEERIAATLQFYGLSACYEQSSHVKVVAGDLSNDLLGLDPATYYEIATSICMVVHCGAQVNSVFPYAALKEANVAGTRRVLEMVLLFGDASSSVDFLHVSTMGFLPPGHPEKPLMASGSGSANVHRILGLSGYAQTKLVAEELLEHVMARSGAETAQRPRRLLVCRPGTVFGHSTTGASNPNDAVSLMLCGLVREGCVARTTESSSPLPQTYNLCPVDHVTAAVAALCFELRGGSAAAWDASGSGCTRVVHLCAPKNDRLSDLVASLRAAGCPIDDVDPFEFCRRFNAIEDPEHPCFSLKALLTGPARPILDSGNGPSPRVENLYRLLKDSKSFVLPPRNVSAECLRRSIEFLMRKQAARTSSVDML